MADDLTEFSDTHTHEIKTPPLVRGMALWLVIVTVAIAVLAVYLNDRRTAADHREIRERHALCAIVNTIPPDVNRAIDQARTVFCH